MHNALDTRAAECSQSEIFPEPPIGGLSKRTIDLAIASVCLAILAPVMLAIAAAIKVSMGGPVLYSHPRVGYGGRMFRCFKFRSMRQNADAILEVHLANNSMAATEWHTMRKLRNDPRVTRLGSLLRRSSLDELPQLINVVRGEMSCVGPRPIVPDELTLYGASAGEYLQVRPGITGLWQVAGRSNIGFSDRVAIDSRYVRNWSHGLDIIILLKTIPAVLFFRGSL